MNKMIAALAVAAAGFASAATAGSYGSAPSGNAMEDAIARKACGEARPVEAEYLANGELKVLCPVLAGTGLGANAALPAIMGVVVLAALAGGSDNATTTTTTSP